MAKKAKQVTAKVREVKRRGRATLHDVEQFVTRGRRAEAAVDVKMQQLPVGDRDERTGRRPGEEDGIAEARLKAEAEDLGPIILPTPQDAHRVLRELAMLYHERFDAQRRHDKVKGELKQIAEELASLTNRIAERIRVATHKTGLPLFADADAELEDAR